MPQPVFADVIHIQAARDPQAVALTHEHRAMAYAQFASAIDAAAACLWHECGVRQGDRLAWLGTAEPAQLVLLFAAARVGAMLVPLNFRLAVVEWDAQLSQCRPRVIVHGDGFGEAAKILAKTQGAQCTSAADLASGLRVEAPKHARADAPVLLVFTSGTTGEPKAAVHTQGNLLANMRIAARVQGMQREDIIATMLPLFHVGGLCIQTLPALGQGARVNLLSKFAPDAAFDVFEIEKPTLTLQVPATMKALVDHPRWPGADLRSLRAVWAGSSMIPQPLIDAFHARGLPVCNLYGATETGPFSIALPAGHAIERAGSCGWPAPEVEAKIVDARDGAGEVWVRGPNVVAHYWPSQPACDADGWFHTGDLARQDADGSFTIVGRAKDLIISGGENIHPAEIEAALALHDSVAECAAFAIEDAQWGEVVGIAVVGREGEKVDEADLRAHLAARIARFKLPRQWFVVESLPKTALGKVQRAALAQLARARR